ncbi:uncharacterized protein isoform X1 [Musca autumnalis]|uniref:uncharacterized protein isoform X1 n=2 Tax=Musca autumnalis TaxID=221902 RepID=UPI003CEC4ABE
MSLFSLLKSSANAIKVSFPYIRKIIGKSRKTTFTCQQCSSNPFALMSTISNKRQPYVISEQAGPETLLNNGPGAFVRMCGGGSVFVPTKTYRHCKPAPLRFGLAVAAIVVPAQSNLKV